MHATRHTPSRSRLLAVVAPLLAIALMAPAAEAAATRAKVVRVLDGETVRVSVAGAPRAVRLLGVDAPARGACFGAEAATALRRLLPRGATVRLTTDGRRRGAYVQRGAQRVNQAMLAGGFATAGRLSGLRQRGSLSAAEERAEAAGRGLWKACAAPPAPPAGAAPVAAPVAPAPVATMSDRLTGELAGRRLRFFESSGGCELGCFITERSLEFCSDGRFAFESKFSTSGNGDERRDEGAWRVRDATLAPDGTLAGTIEQTLLRGTSIDRGEATAGSVGTRQIEIIADGKAFVGGERWFREPSPNCA
jgi:endonuclease YncB( thermonuclease family)